MTKKIAVLYSGGKSFGGIERYIVNLFDRIDKSKFELELLSMGEWELTKRMKQAGQRVTTFSAKRINIKLINNIGKYLSENNIDLLVSQGTVSNAYARLVSRKYHIPNIVTVHSDPNGDYDNPAVRFVYRIVDKVLQPATAKYITVANHLKDKIVAGGVPASKVSVIYNGLEYPKSTVRPHKRLVIGSAGRLHPVKGFDLLIQAFALLENKRLRLKIAGSGDELDNLKSLARNCNVADRVEFVGYQNDIFKFLKDIDVYVQSSHSEGCAFSVAEAMSQGIPVVVAPADGLKEMVSDEQTGFVASSFSPESLAQAMGKAINDFAFSKDIGDNAKQYVAKNFDFNLWIQKTTAAYEEAMK